MIRHLRTAHLEIGYEETGPRDGVPVVLVHGWPDDVRCWDNIAPVLARTGCHVFAPYLRGCSQTCFLSAETLRSGAIAALGQDLADFIGGLDLSNLAVAGHDWGARAAYVVGALFDRRLRGLVAMSAGYATAKPVREMSYDLAKAYWYEWLVATKQGSEAFCKDRRRLCRYLWETEAPGAPEHEELEKQLMRHPPIRVPTIVLHGANDADNFPETSAGEEQFFLNGCERRVLEGVGHFVPREAPGEVVSAIRQILA